MLIRIRAAARMVCAARRRAAASGLLLTALAASGCAAARPVRPAVSARVPPPPEPGEVLAAYDAYCRGIETLSASGDLDLRDVRAGKSQRLSVRLLAGRGGRLYLKGSVAVITAVEVVATGERFWVQVPSKKTVWTGGAEAAPGTDAATEQAPYYALRPADVVAALIPEPLALGEGDSLVMEADRQSLSLTLARIHQGRGLARRQVTLARATLEPVRLRSFDERGELLSEVSLAGFKDGAPRRVAIARPAEGYEATFLLEKAARNVTLPERAFTPRTPAGYKVVEVP